MTNKTLKNKTKATRTNHYRWSSKSPGAHQRTVMLRKCGPKCFLGPNKSFPICSKNTCSINKNGIHAAYVRASQMYSMTKTKNKTKNKMYKQIKNRAYNLLL